MYALQQAMRAIRSNWIASIATITTMTLSLLILSGFSLLSLNLNQFLSALQSELEISAYLDDSADDEQLVRVIATWSEIEAVELIPKEDALRSMVADYNFLQPAVTIVEDNPLPDTLEMRLSDPSQTPFVTQRLRQLPGIDDVEDGSDAVETFLALNDALRVGGSVLIIVLLSSALFAIVNSIRAAIVARRDEIDVMRLVGATRHFIRAPFLIEGFLLGLFSAVVTLAFAIPAYQFIVLRLSDRLPFVPLVRDPALLGRIAVLLTALALLVGLIGSAISVSQHLREET